jgi:hypothetical protein
MFTVVPFHEVGIQMVRNINALVSAENDHSKTRLDQNADPQVIIYGPII